MVPRANLSNSCTPDLVVVPIWHVRLYIYIVRIIYILLILKLLILYEYVMAINLINAGLLPDFL